MGEAKRRKKLDSNFGKVGRFVMEILQTNDDGDVMEVKVTDTQNNKEGVATFRLCMRKNKKLYANVAVFSEETKWIGQNIDKLSPILCKQVLDATDVLLYTLK